MSASPRLVVDVTGLELRTWRRLTGVPRVHLEAAVALASRDDDTIAFSRFDPVVSVFRQVSPDEVLAIGELIRTVVPQRTAGAPSYGRATVRGAARRRVDALPPALRDHVKKAGYHLLGASKETRREMSDAITRRRASGACFSQTWTPATTYCSVGPNWLDGDFDLLERLRASQGFRTALIVYDLIPVIAPQYFWGSDMAPHFTALLQAADVVLTISGSTEHDLRRFAEAHGIAMPATAHLPIGSSIADEIPIQPPEAASLPGPFILMTGSVEIRKNHQLLFDVWQRFVSERSPDRVPTLVVAGQRGWRSDETAARLMLTPELRDVVRFVEGPTDAELAWLYRNCAFTVYPARYEGWGLPVSESLDFGKLCVSSDTSSLPEAGNGLTDLLDPVDRAAWHDRILRYWDAPDVVAAREREITTRYVRVTPRDTARVVLEIAGIATTEPA